MASMETGAVSMETDIAKVEKDIENVEGQIRNVEDQIKQTQDPSERQQLRREEEQLRREEEQLWREEEQLREFQLLKLKEKIAAAAALPAKRPRLVPPSTQEEYLTEMYDNVEESASSFAHRWHSNIKRCSRNEIYLNVCRPSGFYGSNINLFYKFDQFEHDDVTLEFDDAQFTIEFTCCMSEYYPTKKDRVDKLCDLLDKYLQVTLLCNYQYMDAALCVEDCILLIIEVRNEVGHWGCDSYMEGVHYYYQHLKRYVDKKPFPCPMPCLIVEVVGPHLYIYGAVMTDTITVDRLASAWLTFRPTNRAAMEATARTLRTFKNVIFELKSYYKDVLSGCVKNTIFPRFTQFSSDSGSIDQLSYTSKFESRRNMFVATTSNGIEVLVKFVDNNQYYGEAAHRLLASAGFAPQLLCCKAVTPYICMVVMEYISNAQSLKTYMQDVGEESSRRSVLALCNEALTKLHESDYCHGDFRGNNILVQQGTDSQFKVMVVDFDWAGKAGSVRYPHFINPEHNWHHGVLPGRPIKKEHDTHWLAMFQKGTYT